MKFGNKGVSQWCANLGISNPDQNPVASIQNTDGSELAFWGQNPNWVQKALNPDSDSHFTGMVSLPNFIKFCLCKTYKKSEGRFFFLSRDGKSGVKVEKRALVAELTLNMSTDA